MTPILSVQDLRTYYFTSRGVVPAVDSVSFELERGEMLGIVGESGSGKTTLALSLLRLIDPPGRIVGGRVLLDGEDLLALDNQAVRRLRWKRLAFVPQSAMNALNPVFKVGDQIAEAIVFHQRVPRTDALEKAKALLELVQIDARRAEAYPHEFSGGMRQRVGIALALANNPDIVIADEPTTGLDVLAQAHLLCLIKRLQKNLLLSMVLISHDVLLVAKVCDRVAVMHAGKLVERATAADLLKEPRHPYTRTLLTSCVTLEGGKIRVERVSGHLPERIERAHELRGLKEKALVRVINLTKVFKISRGVLRSRAAPIIAIDNISFEIRSGEVFGLIGASGAGKTTIGKLIIRLLEPTGGRVYFEGVEVTGLPNKELRGIRRRMQMILQDPYTSLNPSMKVFDIVSEPLLIHGVDRNETENFTHGALEAVALRPPETFSIRFPHELSGGQRQRVAIARSLVLKPKLIVADEPVSMLDASVRAEILDLMLDLKDLYHLTYLFITHDLGVARYVCDYIAVMRRGRILEMGPTDAIIEEPLHPYTQALLAAVSDPLSMSHEESRGLSTEAYQEPSCVQGDLKDAGRGHYVAL